MRKLVAFYTGKRLINEYTTQFLKLEEIVSEALKNKSVWTTPQTLSVYMALVEIEIEVRY